MLGLRPSAFIFAAIVGCGTATLGPQSVAAQSTMGTAGPLDGEWIGDLVSSAVTSECGSDFQSTLPVRLRVTGRSVEGSFQIDDKNWQFSGLIDDKQNFETDAPFQLWWNGPWRATITVRGRFEGSKFHGSFYVIENAGGGSFNCAGDVQLTSPELTFAMAQQSAARLAPAEDERDIPLGDIVLVQRALARLENFTLHADGVLGPKTRAAIRAYQQHTGRLVTGYLNTELAAELSRKALEFEAAGAAAATTERETAARQAGAAQSEQEQARLARVAAEEKRLRDLKARQESEKTRLAEMRAEEEARLANLRAAEAERLAKLRADEEARLARIRAERAKLLADEEARLAKLREDQQREAERLAAARTKNAKPAAPPPIPATMLREPRVALVVGNSNYANSPLRNASNDARLMARSLRSVGFDVIEKVEATRRDMRLAMIEFGDRLEKGGVGLFYYAGHGVQVGGENYLMPIGAKVRREAHIPVEGVSVNQVLARMEGARNRLNIVVLDACRNNPYARSFRSSQDGLAQLLAPAGTYIAYATAPGQVARDGGGGNSPFTEAIAEAIVAPNLKLEDVFKKVRLKVKRASNGQQIPWTSSSIIGDFYFSLAGATAGGGAPSTSAPTGFDQRQLDMTFWQSVKDSPDRAGFEAYLKRFPDGIFSELARIKLKQLGGR